jgi:hypothetical protein
VQIEHGRRCLNSRFGLHSTKPIEKPIVIGYPATWYFEYAFEFAKWRVLSVVCVCWPKNRHAKCQRDNRRV